jgi:hypothetical protein
LTGLATLQRLARPEAGIFLVLWLLLMIGGRDRLFRDPGTYWHTRLGLKMLDSHQLIYGDPFSFTAGSDARGQNWIPHQWLGECLMGLLYQAGGWDLLHLATATILAALYTWIAHRLIVAGLHWSLAIALMILSFAAGSSHFHVRPHLSTMVFFGMTFAWLADFEAGRKSLRQLAWLVPIYVLWTNLHGGMLGGLFTIALSIAGWVVFRGIGWETPIGTWRVLRDLVLLFVACGLTAFVNPYGLALPGEWLNIMGQTGLGKVIIEHQPLDLTEPVGMMVAVVAVVYIVLLGAACTRRRPRVTWLLPLVWLALAVSRVRHASLFGIAAGLAIAEIFPETPWAESIAKSGSDLFDAARGRAARSPGLLAFLLPIALVLAAAGMKAENVVVPILGSGWAGYNADTCPLGMEKHTANRPDGTPIFNELNFGGYLIFFAPNLRIFVDDRAELYGEDFLLEYSRAEVDPHRTNDFLNRYSFDLALTRTGSGYDHFFRRPNSGWTAIETTEAATLYQRTR